MPAYPLVILGFAAGLSAIGDKLSAVSYRRPAVPGPLARVAEPGRARGAIGAGSGRWSAVGHLWSVTGLLLALTILVAYRFRRQSAARRPESPAGRHRPRSRLGGAGRSAPAELGDRGRIRRVAGAAISDHASGRRSRLWFHARSVAPGPDQRGRHLSDAPRGCRRPGLPGRPASLRRRGDPHSSARPTPVVQLPASARPLAVDFGPTMTLAGFETQVTPVDGVQRSPLGASPARGPGGHAPHFDGGCRCTGGRLQKVTLTTPSPCARCGRGP